MSALTLLVVGCLQADTLPVDPNVKFKTSGGGGSIDIQSGGVGCFTSFGTLECTSTNPLDLIQANGFANLSVKNLTGQTITQLIFYIPTTNFDQTFTASSPDFQNALVSTGGFLGVDLFEIPGVCGGLTGGVIKTSCIAVSFFSGTATNSGNPCSSGINPLNPGNPLVPINPTNPCTLAPDKEDTPPSEGPGPAGFVPGGQVVVAAFFGGPLGGFPGFLNNADGSLTLSADAPEPATLGLMLTGLVGMALVARRRRQTA